VCMTLLLPLRRQLKPRTAKLQQLYAKPQATEPTYEPRHDSHQGGCDCECEHGCAHYLSFTEPYLLAYHSNTCRHGRQEYQTNILQVTADWVWAPKARVGQMSDGVRISRACITDILLHALHWL
jgi:hypothetical protein